MFFFCDLLEKKFQFFLSEIRKKSRLWFLEPLLEYFYLDLQKIDCTLYR
jgi:hypothetical protein